MTTPSPSIRLAVADASYRLSPTERAGVRPGFDVDALERLLAAVEAPVRPILLAKFQKTAAGEPPPALVRMGDPALQPLLEEVWAPMWELLPPDAIDTETARWPGREIARKRRQERAAPKAQQ